MKFAATWMDLEGILLSEISQTKKDKYCRISLNMWNLKHRWIWLTSLSCTWERASWPACRLMWHCPGWRPWLYPTISWEACPCWDGHCRHSTPRTSPSTSWPRCLLTPWMAWATSRSSTCVATGCRLCPPTPLPPPHPPAPGAHAPAEEAQPGWKPVENITKQKQPHRYREQTSCYQWGEGKGEGQYRGRRLKGTNY